jgi:hypothetical protein
MKCVDLEGGRQGNSYGTAQAFINGTAESHANQQYIPSLGQINLSCLCNVGTLRADYMAS